MNSTTRGYLLGLKDGSGRPYFTLDPSMDSVFGKLIEFDVVVNQAMPDIAANAAPILSGSCRLSITHRLDSFKY